MNSNVTAGRATRPNPIEYSILHTLQEDVADNDPEIMLELIDIFMTDSEDHLSSIARNIESQEYRKLEIAAHSLKSSSATFGAMTLAGLSAQIEQLARAKAVSSVTDILETAHAEFKLVAAVLATERKKWMEIAGR